MKSIILITLAVVAAVVAAPPKDTKIVRSDLNQAPDGNYELYVETDDGTVRQETGVVKEILDEEKKPHKVITVIGSYSYINDKGQPESINYQADEEGFKAQGASIPQVARR